MDVLSVDVFRIVDVFSSVLLFVSVFVCLFVCLHDNFQMTKHRIMKLGG